MPNQAVRRRHFLLSLPLLLLVFAVLMLVPAITAAPQQALPCEGEGYTEACVDVQLLPEELIGDIYVDDQLVASGVNPARVSVTPRTTVRIEARNVRDGQPDFGDLYVFNEPGTNIWVPAGQVYRYTLYPQKVFIKGYLQFTCDIRSAREGEHVACRPFIDGRPYPDLRPGEEFTYGLETGQHTVLVRVVGEQKDLWNPAEREQTVNIFAGGTSYLRSRFDKKGLLTIALSQEGVRGDLYVDGTLVAQQAPSAQLWVEPYTSLRVEGKNFQDPAAGGNYTLRDASTSAYLSPGQERTATLQLYKEIINPQAATQTQTQTVQQPSTQTTSAPSVAAGSASRGGFELGGMVRGDGYYEYMHEAGMTWVKYQVRGLGADPSAEIGAGHANGFKVLISVLGGHDIDFAAWTHHFGALAALGPDAIEVWNEPNFSREWPEQYMGGDNYVNLMLAPAYNAIKAANPNVMVISGAPTPTGAFQGCSFQAWIPMTGCDDNVWINQVAAAGGARYMDCVGMHFNAGATSPYANSGHPAGTHYSWYYGGMTSVYRSIGRPLCFTELGYAIGPSLPPTFAWANGNTVDEQAQWLAEAAALSSRSGVRLMIVWNVGGFFSGDGDPQGAYSIVRPNADCPACRTLGSVMGR